MAKIVPSGGDDASGPEEFGDLYGELPSDAGGAMDQDSFARNKLRTPSQREPGRHAGIGQGRGCSVIHSLRDLEAVRPRHDRTLGHRSVGGSGPAEENAGAVVEIPNPVHSADDG